MVFKVDLRYITYHSHIIKTDQSIQAFRETLLEKGDKPMRKRWIKRFAVVALATAVSVYTVPKTGLLAALGLSQTTEAEEASSDQKGPGGNGTPPEPPSGAASGGAIGGGQPGDAPGTPPSGAPDGGLGGQGQPGGAPGGTSSGVSDYSAVNKLTSDAVLDGQTITSTGTDENAVNVSEGANVTVKNSTISRESSDSTGGDNSSFYGVGSALLCTDGVLNVVKDTITTNAAGGAGVFAYGDGTANVADTTITTSRDTSGGIHVAGGGTLHAWNVTAETSGQSSAAIRSDRGGGTMVVDGGTYTSNGKGSPAIYSTADISVHDAKLTANGSEAICIEGLNTIRLYDCDLTGNMKDDSQNDCTWNVILYQSMSGDSQVGNSTFEMQGGSLTAKNGGMFYTTNTESTFTLKDVDITNADDSEFFLKCTGNSNQRGWGTSGSNGADCLFTAISQKMNGDIIWDSISQLDLYMTEGSNLKGTVVQDESCAGNGGSGYSSIYIDKDSTWIVTGDSTVTNLYNAGTIQDADGKSVTIKNSSGKVYVKGSSSYTITVENYSATADMSGASNVSSWSDYAVDQSTAIKESGSTVTAVPSTTAEPSQTTASDKTTGTSATAAPSGTTAGTSNSSGTVSSDSATSVKAAGKTTVSSAKRTADGKKIKVSLKTVAAAGGYQVRYSTDKKYSKSKTKTLTTTKNNVTVKKVSKSKKYYISARTYKVVNGKKYWSAWSSSKKA